MTRQAAQSSKLVETGAKTVSTEIVPILEVGSKVRGQVRFNRPVEQAVAGIDEDNN